MRKTLMTTVMLALMTVPAVADQWTFQDFADTQDQRVITSCQMGNDTAVHNMPSSGNTFYNQCIDSARVARTYVELLWPKATYDIKMACTTSSQAHAAGSLAMAQFIYHVVAECLSYKVAPIEAKHQLN